MEDLYKKEIAFKLNTDNNINLISNLLQISNKESKSFLIKYFLSTFYIYKSNIHDLSFVKEYINTLLFAYRFKYKEIQNFYSEFYNIIASYHNLKTYDIKNAKVIYLNDKLFIEYLNNNTKIQDSIKIPHETYDRILNFTLDRSKEHANLIFLRYLYGMDFGGKNFAMIDFDALKENGYQLECFGSSFNRSLDYFCALYDDIDIYSQGFLGNFFELTAEKLIKNIKWQNNLIKLNFNPPFIRFIVEPAFQRLYEIIEKCHNVYNYNFELSIDLPSSYKQLLKSIIDQFSQFSTIDFLLLDSKKHVYIDRLLNKKLRGLRHITDMKILIKSKNKL
jgi:hypothetical protein